MDLLQDFAFIAMGLVALVYGGDYTVRGAVQVAEKLGLSPAVVGIGVIGFGTSLPEMLVAIKAVSDGSPAIALGNVVGSNIANILLVLGIGALFAPQLCQRRIVMRDGVFMVLVSLLLIPVLVDTVVLRSTGLAMVIGLILYLVMTYISDKGSCDKDVNREEPISMPKALVYLIGGLVLLMMGADVFVDGTVSVARAFDVPESIIGLSLVAIGTSLPELAATIVAALRQQTEIAIGNVLGSNIFNILGVLGVTGLVVPFDFAGTFAMRDGWIALALSVILVGILFWQKRLSRGLGAIMLITYATYIYSIF